MHIIEAVVQLPVSQPRNKCQVIFKWTSDGLPNQFGVGVILCELCNRHMKRVRDPAALVMHNVVISAYRCPNEPFARKTWIDNGIGCLPFSIRLCELLFVTGTKSDNRPLQIVFRMRFVKARNIL